MSRSCGSSAMTVGGTHRLPEDPCEYNPEGSDGPGCNQLQCQNCGAHVRASAPGFRAQESMRREDTAELYATEEWSSSPFVMAAGPSWRLYACRCIYWDEGAEHFLINDGDSPGDAHMNWRCGSHPVPVLPLALGKLTISTTPDWPALVQQILDGECPRQLERKDEGPWLWLCWLYAYLEGLPGTSELSRAIASRITDRDERVIGAVLIFFRRFPTADGVSQVFAYANADPARVPVLHAVPETDYQPSLWNMLIGMLQNRTAENPATEAVDLIRKVMLTSTAGTRDPLKETLSRTWEANAFRLDDAEWMSENIVALEAAGPGRWKPLMNLIVAFARNDDELESMIVVSGIALIQSGRVPAADIRAWIKQRAYRSDAWAQVLTSALDEKS